MKLEKGIRMIPELGMYFRVKREGQWVNLDILEMNEYEIVQAMRGKSERFLLKVIWELTHWIAANVMVEE